MSDHEHQWQDTGFATVEDCAVPGCDALRSAGVVTRDGTKGANGGSAVGALRAGGFCSLSLADIVKSMDPATLQRYASTLDDDDLALLEQVMGDITGESWRTDPAAMGAFLDPTYTRPPYIRHLSKKFRQLVTGESRRQVWNLAGRLGKSRLGSQWGPAWCLDRTEGRARLILTSYGDKLADENADAVREILRQHSSLLRCQLRRDRQARDRFVTDAGGGLIAAGIDATIVGFGAGQGGGIIIDDPFKSWQEAHSEAKRDHIWNQFRGNLLNRSDDESCFILVIHHRVHEDDLTARLQKSMLDQDEYGDKWDVTALPSIAQENDVLGREPGEVLDPDRFPLHVVRNRMAAMGSYLASALELQNPSPEEGNDIKREWWVLDDNLPSVFDAALSSWDMKLKEKESGDYVVGQVWGRTGSDFWCLAELRGQWNQATARAAIALTAVRFPSVKRHVIENTGYGPEVMAMLRAGSGVGYDLDAEIAGELGMTESEAAAVQTLLREGMPGLIPNNPRGDKRVRARAVTPLIEARNCHLPAHAPWVAGFLEEQCVIGSTPIVTRMGLKPASDVQVGDEVLTHRGRFRPVEVVQSRDASDLVTIQAKGLDPLTLTENHRVLSLPVGTLGEGRRVAESEWRPAGTLRLRQYTLSNRGQYEPTTAAFDTLTVPVLSPDADLVEIDLRAWFDYSTPPDRDWKFADDGETVRLCMGRAQALRYRQRLDYDFGWLCGIWLAEGSWSHGRAQWSFHEDETVFHDKVRALVKDRLGVDTSIYSPGHSHALIVNASLRRLGEWFATFGTGAKNKRIPWWAWEAPGSFHEGMMDGWLDGDGCEGKGTTASHDLAWGMRLLATRVGTWGRFVRLSERQDLVINGRKTRGSGGWNVNLNQHGDVTGHVTDGDLFGLALKRVEMAEPERVFDLQVAEDASFLTTGGLVHNSSFPNGAYDDRVDAMSQALSKLSTSGARISAPGPQHVR